MTVVLGGAPAEVVKVPIRGLLLLCSATGVVEGGGCCVGLGAAAFALVGGGCCVNDWPMGLTLATARGCELVGGVAFKPGSCCWVEFELRPDRFARSAVDGPSREGRSIVVTRRSSGRSSK